MTLEQMKVLESTDAFPKHPKVQDYKKNLTEEYQQREAQRMKMQAKQQEFQQLSEWSKTIVQICRWLEGKKKQ